MSTYRYFYTEYKDELYVCNFYFLVHRFWAGHAGLVVTEMWVWGSDPRCADQLASLVYMSFTAFWKDKNSMIYTAKVFKLIHYFSRRQLTSVMHYKRIKEKMKSYVGQMSHIRKFSVWCSLFCYKVLLKYILTNSARCRLFPRCLRVTKILQKAHRLPTMHGDVIYRSRESDFSSSLNARQS
jgi:hypothetical protein